MSIVLNWVVWNAALATMLAILIWLVAMLPLIRRRPGLRHVLWTVVLLKLVTPPLVELSVVPNWFTAERTRRIHPSAILLDGTTGPLLSHQRVLVPGAAIVSPLRQVDWMAMLAVINGIVVLSVLTCVIGQTWRLRRALRRGKCDDKRLLEIARRCAKSLGLAVPPQVCVVSANIPPLLWVRLAGPLVVIPRRLVDQLSDEQLACVVSHEIAHYVRRDHWANLVSMLVTAVCWWNPVAWWARRELRVAQEACCDALVISRSVASRRTYAETLFHALEYLQAERATLPAVASGFGGKSSTHRRFEMIANSRVNHRLSWWSYPVLLTALSALPLLPAFTQAQDASADVEDVLTMDLDGIGLQVPGGVTDLDDVVVEYDRLLFVDASQSIRRTDRRSYKIQRSQRGWIVLAFDKESNKLAWSSEIEFPRGKAAGDGQRYLLHAGDGVVTIAVAGGDGVLTLQELDAGTGKVTGQCRLLNQPTAYQHVNRKYHVEAEAVLDVDGSHVELKKSELDGPKIDGRIRRLKVREQLEKRSEKKQGDNHERDPDKYMELLDRDLLEKENQRLKEDAHGTRNGQEGSSTKPPDALELAIELAEETKKDGERSVPGEYHFRVRPTVKRVGYDAIIELRALSDGQLSVATASTVWRLVNGDAPVESIRITRQDGTTRMTIEGKDKRRRLVILVVDDGGQAAQKDEGAKAVDPTKDPQAIPEGGVDPGEGTSSHGGEGDPDPSAPPASTPIEN